MRWGWLGHGLRRNAGFVRNKMLKLGLPGKGESRKISEEIYGWMDGSKEDKEMVGVTVEEAGSKVREK